MSTERDDRHWRPQVLRYTMWIVSAPVTGCLPILRFSVTFQPTRCVPGDQRARSPPLTYCLIEVESSSSAAQQASMVAGSPAVALRSSLGTSASPALPHLPSLVHCCWPFLDKLPTHGDTPQILASQLVLQDLGGRSLGLRFAV